MLGEGGSDPLDRHVGTRDTDPGFAVGLVEEGSYTEVSTQVARCGFAPEENEKENLTPQRWLHEEAGEQGDCMLKSAGTIQLTHPASSGAEAVSEERSCCLPP